MSKAGKFGTLFSIYSGFVFAIFGLILITWGIFTNYIGSLKGISLILGIMILVYGLILIFGGIKQYKGIQKGKEYPGPPEGFKMI